MITLPANTSKELCDKIVAQLEAKNFKVVEIEDLKAE